MGLFDEVIGNLDGFLRGKQAAGEVREYAPEAPRWPAERSVVLKADTALELGNPQAGSLSLLLWSGDADRFPSDRIVVVGPELRETADQQLPLGRVVVARGVIEDQYESYRELADAVGDVNLRGVTSRSLPSRNEIWLRVSHDVLGQGLGLREMGDVLVDRLKQVDFIQAVEVIYITSGKEDIRGLSPSAEKARTIIDALVKMYDEMNFDCEECEYVEVCDEVVELRGIRERLKERS
jgi:CO dehydrogenase/acetyl-CoA synthase beta subunit